MKRFTNLPIAEALIAFYWAAFLGIFITHSSPSFEIVRFCALLAAAPAYLCAYACRQIAPSASSGVQRLGCKKHRDELALASSAPVTKYRRLVALTTWVPIIGFPTAVWFANKGGFGWIPFAILYSGWFCAFALSFMVVAAKVKGKQKAMMLLRTIPLAAAVPLTGSMPLPP